MLALRTPRMFGIRLLMACAFTIAVAWSAGTADAQAAYSYRYTQAIAQFTIEVDGQETYAMVAAADAREMTGPGGYALSAPVAIQIGHSPSTSCFASNLPGAYSQTALWRAELSAALECIDGYGTPAGTVDVAVTWQGYEPLNGPFTYTYHRPDWYPNWVYHLTQRQASASGTLTLGGVTYQLTQGELDSVLEQGIITVAGS